MRITATETNGEMGHGPISPFSRNKRSLAAFFGIGVRSFHVCGDVKQATVVRKAGSLFNLRQDDAALSRLPSSNFPLDT
jgi:hypothetical protein